MVARTPAEVVAGEAVFGSSQWEDMLGVASVISNRARQLGISPQQVVARQSEFNAYGKPLPKGQAKNVALAEKALRHVQEFGPVHHGTFFATPATTGNLPRGLNRITQTKGHVYFSDPSAVPSTLLSAHGAIKLRRHQFSRPMRPRPCLLVRLLQSISPSPRARSRRPLLPLVAR